MTMKGKTKGLRIRKGSKGKRKGKRRNSVLLANWLTLQVRDYLDQNSDFVRYRQPNATT